MVNLDEIARIMGSDVPRVSSEKTAEKKAKIAAKKPIKQETVEKKEADIAETKETENIEEKIIEKKNQIEEKTEELSKKEELKEQKEIDKEYVDPLSQNYKRVKNNLIGKRVLK
jgi:hypothetical protein